MIAGTGTLESIAVETRPRSPNVEIPIYVVIGIANAAAVFYRCSFLRSQRTLRKEVNCHWP